MQYPWDRRDNETDRAWHLFNIYIQMEPPRWRKDFLVAAHVSRNTYLKYWKEHDWQARAAALDEFRAQAAISANIQAIKDREIERVMQVVSARRLAFNNITAQSDQLKPADSIKLFDITLKAEIGIDTLENARKGQDDDGIDYSLLTDEERAQIVELYAKVDSIVLSAMKARKGNGRQPQGGNGKGHLKDTVRS